MKHLTRSNPLGLFGGLMVTVACLVFPQAATATVCFDSVGCFNESGMELTPYPQPPNMVNMSFLIFDEQNLRKVKNKFMYWEMDELLDFMSCLPTSDNGIQKSQYSNLTILIHGFWQDIVPQEKNPDEFSFLKDALIKTLLPRGNLILTVDWAEGARPPDYLQAAVNTRLVGRHISNLLREVFKRKCIAPENVHLIGFSLGAHVAGFAGQYVRDEEHTLIGRISGLDPAGPSFESHPDNCLSRDDAVFVDGIHTSSTGSFLGGHYGMSTPVGHIDFYPNGGHEQPRCAGFAHILDFRCKHLSVLVYYMVSITRECAFESITCPSEDDYIRRECEPGQEPVLMGYWTDRTKTGAYYLPVRQESPHCDPEGFSVIRNELHRPTAPHKNQTTPTTMKTF